MTALQLAAYFGDYLTVQWLLYSGWSKEMKTDCQEALKIAKHYREKETEQRNERNSKAAKENHNDAGTGICDYVEVIDTLQDPLDFVQGSSKKDRLHSKPTANPGFKKLVEDFDATIVDCYRKSMNPGEEGYKRVDFLRRTRSVWDIVYGTDPKAMQADPKTMSIDEEKLYGPSDIMKNARKRHRKIGTNPKIARKELYDEDDLQFRWLHLSANNELTKRIYRDKERTEEEFSSLAEFLRQSFNELPGEKPYLRPSCTEQNPRLRVSKRDAAELKESAGGSKKLESIKCPILALYMPYLTSATYNGESDKIRDKNKKLTDEYSPSDVSETGVQSNTDKNTDNYWKKLHESRTWDQFYYNFMIQTEKRDESQVVTRYIQKNEEEPEKETGKEKWWRKPLDEIKREKENREMKWKSEKRNKEEKMKGKKQILRVDQLWLWVIDEKTIITSSTHRLDDGDPVSERIFTYLREAEWNKNGQFPLSTIAEMTEFITIFYIDQIERSIYNYRQHDLSAMQIFSNTINNAKADTEVKLFDEFYRKIKIKLRELNGGRKKEAKIYRKLLGEKEKEEHKKEEHEKEEHEKEEPAPENPDQTGYTEQEKDYKYIHEATKLLKEVKDIRDELYILNYLLKQQKGVWEEFLEILDGKAPRGTEKQKGPENIIKDVDEMEKIAQKIQESLNDLLSLEQNEASLSEAGLAREQGTTVLIFTIITIIFLPMSFLTSLFALNVTNFPHTDNNISYKPKFIFSIIFGITAAISIPVILYALEQQKFNKIVSRLKGRLTKPIMSGIDKDSLNLLSGAVFSGDLEKPVKLNISVVNKADDIDGKGIATSQLGQINYTIEGSSDDRQRIEQQRGSTYKRRTKS
ncbi:hypothetical protein ACMFMG_001188 [Clarireedia jacksonii]